MARSLNIIPALALVAGVLAATPPQAQAWYLSMGDSPADIDHIQLRMADGYQFAQTALPFFFSTDLDGSANDWSQDFINDKQNMLIAHGPSLGSEPLGFSLYLEGDQNNDLPRFHYQSYLDGQRVSNFDFYVTGPGNTDVEILAGTWQQDSPYETYDYDSPAWAFARGDADLDGDADLSDLQAWQLNYTGQGGTGKTWAEGNWNEDLGDEAVDLTDLQQWQLNYTGQLTGPPPLHTRDDYPGNLVATPEPGAAGLVVMSLLGLALRRQRRTVA